MMRLVILDSDGKVRSPKDLDSAAQLLALVEQARNLVRECERLAQQKSKTSVAPGSGKVPYSS